MSGKIKGDVFDLCPNNTFDSTANDSDKEWTVPAGKVWKIGMIYVTITTSADAGNRTMYAYIYDGTVAAGNIIYANRNLAVIAASTTATCHWAPSLRYDNSSRMAPLPNPCILKPGWTIRVFDSAAIAAAADDMTVSLWYSEVDA